MPQGSKAPQHDEAGPAERHDGESWRQARVLPTGSVAKPRRARDTVRALHVPRVTVRYPAQRRRRGWGRRSVLLVNEASMATRVHEGVFRQYDRVPAQ